MAENTPISRKDFLKLAAAGTLGFVLAETGLGRVLAQTMPSHTQGRIVYSGISLCDQPSINAKTLRVFNRDEVVPLTEVVTGLDADAYNPHWYRIGSEGYAYSGYVQPVETMYNRPVLDIPSAGRLAEVTVPFSDVYRIADSRGDRGYRLYYGSLHWVTRIALNREEKSIWYEIYDDQIKASYFGRVQDFRIISPDELAPISPDVPAELKKIYIDLDSQSVAAYEGDTNVLMTRCASGTKGTNTPLGTYYSYHKGPSIHMTDGDDRDLGTYDLPGVPWVTFFTGEGHSFHGTYWHNDYGSPRSHGCINLTPEDSRFIYLWTTPYVPPETRYLHLPGQGTTIEIVKPAAE
ncbi:MAG: L,D-transpeptidase [Anaerolineales bacterium]|nr:L,D-transpeptidase [Anaerolineales bacterium]